MKKKTAIKVFTFSSFIFLFGLIAAAMASMANYTALPPFLSQTVKPNVLVIFDTSGSMAQYAFPGNYDPNRTYGGYFAPTADYSYNSTYKYFYEDASGTWDGNLLNWISMRRMDIAKKVLTGGRTTTAGDGSTLLLGQPYPNGFGWPDGFETYTKSYGGHSYYNQRVVDATGPYFRLDNATTGDPYYIRVKVDSTPQGVIQNSGPYYRFGLQIYSPKDDADQGGRVLSPVAEGSAAHITDIVNHINGQNMLSDPVGRSCFTAMAENLYTAAGYYAQSSTVSSNGPMYASGEYQVNNAWDPYYYNTHATTIWCAKAFVVFISDGEATHDGSLPASLKTSYGITGSSEDYLDDVALWAHTNDIRTSSFGIDLEGRQSITLYTISTFGGGEDLLKSAAKFGGFVDSNGNNLPDLNSEWDNNSDGLPDNYSQASTPEELQDALYDALNDIMKRVAAGSAISVLSTSETGKGAVYQAFFYPNLVDSNGKEITWPGYLRALLIDEYGNLREDTDSDAILDMTGDKIIDYFFDDVENRVRVKRYTDSDGDGVRDGSPETVEINDLNSLWAAGKVLAATSPSARTIYTWIDNDTTGTVGTVDTGEFSSSWFDTTNKTTLRPYLGVATATDAENVISYVRGTDDPGLGYTNRSRLIDVDGTDRVWKLGDIVYSTPAAVGKPMENFDFIYGDTSYATFKNTYKDRRNVVYVGANDGMLHAFNAGFYDAAQSQFTAGTGKTLGEELWAYIPYNLLPHLQWLADPSYSHVYYVDLTPRVLDAKIFSADATHPGGWGTVLVCGMRLGGGTMGLTDDFGSGSSTTRSFRSAYFALDITDPESAPDLLWEFTDANLGFTTSYPAVIYVDASTWAIAFGSGPTDYDGTSTQYARTYVIDLSTGQQLTGSPITTGNTTNNDSFMGDAISVDLDIRASQCSSGSCSYSSDLGYIGNSEGKLYRITGTTSASAGTASVLVNTSATTPIISAPAVSMDNDGRFWVYFGTGRFFAEGDKVNADVQALVGVKEPIDLDDADTDGDYEEFTYAEATQSLVVTDYTVFEGSYVDTDGNFTTYETTFDALVDDMKQYAAETAPRDHDGWVLALTGGERCITKPTVLGGIVTFSTYKPIADICSYEGDSYLYALYYKTGTAYYKNIIGIGDDTMTVGSETHGDVLRRKALGHGVSASPSLHVGKRKGARVVLQTSTGEIVEIDEVNLPEAYKSRPLHWIQPGN
jgi:type IV pilus assembly protein PilY1